jgi:hypothetical protein
MDEVRFEVTTAAADTAARRLTTAAKVQAVLFGGTATDTALIETMIDRVSAAAARYCNLAADAIGTVPTFGRETCRATWQAVRWCRHSQLLLPWRVPIASITSIVEDGVTLTSGTDYRMLKGGVLERLSGDYPRWWSSAKIVVVYVTGWDLTDDDQTPADLEAAVIDQVKAMYAARTRDPNLKSAMVQDVGAETFGDPGAAVSDAVADALDAYRSWPIA